MKITLLTDGIYPYVMGGMQMHSFHLARALARAGVQVDLYHYIPKGNEKVLLPFTDEELANLRVIAVDYPALGRLPGHYIRERHQYSQKLLQRYRESGNDSDFIYAQGLTGRAFIDAKRAGEKLPTVGINAHGYEMFQWAPNLKTKLQHFMLRPAFAHVSQKADVVFSFSGKIREIVEQTLKVPAERIVEIPNGIDASWLVDAPAVHEGPLRFVFVGRYERRKGIEELHQVIERLDADSCEFHFIGPIPEHLRLKRPNVRYHGRVMDAERMKQLLDQCDVLLCPSYAEGMPTVILEAMARGLAIIATDVGATRSMVSSENGLLLPTPDVDALFGAVNTLSACSTSDLLNLKQGSLEQVQHFSWDQVVGLLSEDIGYRLGG